MFAVNEVMSQRELELALKDICKGQFDLGMETIVIFEKRNDQSDRLFKIFMDKPEIFFVELKRKIAKTSLYRLLSYRLDIINAVLKETHPSLFFLERGHIRKNSRLLITYRLNPNCDIIDGDGCFILKFRPVLSRYKKLSHPGIEP